MTHAVHDHWEVDDSQRRYRREPPRPPSDRWEFDKRIPLAVVLTILAQSLAIAWGASQLESRVSGLEVVSARLESEGPPVMQVRVARLEEQAIVSGRILERLTSDGQILERVTRLEHDLPPVRGRSESDRGDYDAPLTRRQ